MRVGVYGGSFNPPHMAHVLVVAWALATGEVDAVWIIPTGGHPFGKDLAPFLDRMEMCRRAFGCFGERVCLLEIEAEPRRHYSIETLRRLAAEHPTHSWRWIMGSDTLADAPRWREFEALMRLAPPLTVPRAGHRPLALPPEGGGSGQAPDWPERFALPDLSSTQVREMIARGQDPSELGLVARGVMDWIRSTGLYGTNPAATH